MSRRLLYLVTEDWYFFSHRLPMARAAKRAGFDVHVATRVSEYAHAIKEEGFVLHPLSWRRGSVNPFHLLSVAAEVRQLYINVCPALVHHVALAPTIIGSIAAIGLPIVILNAFAGLGFAFTSNSLKARVMRVPLIFLLRCLLRRRRATVLVQNPDDRREIEAIGLNPGKIVLIPGSGVDVEALKPQAEPPEPITIGFVGRLLHDKGVATLVAAHRILLERKRRVHLLIAGETDPANPASIPEVLLAEWKKIPNVSLPGHVADIRTFWAKAHIAVLPSLREGLPLSLLEAAACGRPIVATNVPGCREIAREGLNAFLVPPHDPAALANAIDRLAADLETRRRFGAASRRIAETEFSAERIGDEVVALYNRLLLTASP